MNPPMIERRDGRRVVTLTIDRTERRNAIDGTVADAMIDAFARIEADAAVRAVVIAGAGMVFCAGTDIDWLSRIATQDASANRADSERLAAMYRAIDSCTRPVVARVQGGAYAGGCSLVAACDVVVAADDARFAITEARLGLTPSLILPYMAGRVGLRQIRRFCLTGEAFDAATARRIGLVSRVVPAASLDTAVAATVDALLRCAPGSLAETKALVREWTRPPVTDQALNLSVDVFAASCESREARAGVVSRREGRAPNWSAGNG